MKALAFAALCLLFPSMAEAASPEDSYFAARDAAIVRMGALPDLGVSGPYDEAVKQLEQTLRPLVGPISVKGFGGAGKLNLDSLVKGDEGFGTLDGLSFAATGGKGAVLVTSEAIFRHWLVEHKDWWGAELQNVPQTPEAALKSNAFYTQALSTDAAIIQFADLPVTSPSKTDFIYATLIGRTQDDTAELAANEIIVTFFGNGHLLVANMPARAKFTAIPACTKARKSADQKIEAATDAYINSGRKNEALAAKARKLQEETDAAFQSCLSAKVKVQKGFADALAQAQALANDMAAGAR